MHCDLLPKGGEVTIPTKYEFTQLVKIGIENLTREVSEVIGYFNNEPGRIVLNALVKIKVDNLSNELLTRIDAGKKSARDTEFLNYMQRFRIVDHEARNINDALTSIDQYITWQEADANPVYHIGAESPHESADKAKSIGTNYLNFPTTTQNLFGINVNLKNFHNKIQTIFAIQTIDGANRQQVLFMWYDPDLRRISISRTASDTGTMSHVLMENPDAGIYRIMIFKGGVGANPLSNETTQLFVSINGTILTIDNPYNEAGSYQANSDYFFGYYERMGEAEVFSRDYSKHNGIEEVKIKRSHAEPTLLDIIPEHAGYYKNDFFFGKFCNYKLFAKSR